MPENTCISCRRPKASLQCELCQEDVCKDCVQLLEPETFSFKTELRDELKHLRYCQFCYDSEVAPELETYEETMERAKAMFFFFDTQKSRLPILEKSDEMLVVNDNPDRDETILRLAFQAAERGYNAVIEANVSSEKVRNQGYQKSKWKGRGIAANVDVDKLERHLRHYE